MKICGTSLNGVTLRGFIEWVVHWIQKDEYFFSQYFIDFIDNKIKNKKLLTIKGFFYFKVLSLQLQIQIVSQLCNKFKAVHSNIFPTQCFLF